MGGKKKINFFNFKVFKKRKNSLNCTINVKLRFGNIGLFFKKNFRFEFVYLVFLKKQYKYLNPSKLKFRKTNKL